MYSHSVSARLLLLVSLFVAMLPAATAEVTYHISNVGYASGTDDVGTLSGFNFGAITSGELPVKLTERSASYNFNPGKTGASNTGTWFASDASHTNTLSGTFSTTATGGIPGYSVFQRFTGAMMVTGGTGYYSGAQGGGTFENYVVFTGFQFPNNPTNTLWSYLSVNVDHLNVMLADGLPQTDTRGVSIAVKKGLNDVSTNPATGSNAGPIVSSPPSNLPPLTFNSASYNFIPNVGPPSSGTFLETNGAGDSMAGTFFSNEFEETLQLGFVQIGHSFGDSQHLHGTGAYAGLTGTSQYEYFHYFLPPHGPDLFGYEEVVINRGQLVPEPETYALLCAGLVMLAFVSRRRERLV